MKLLASVSDVGGIEDGRNHANAPGTGGKNFIDILQCDAADGEPRAIPQMLSGPAYVLERHTRAAGLGGSGKNGPHSDVIGILLQRGLGLFGSMRAETKLRPGKSQLRRGVIVRLKKILLTKVTKFRPQLAGERPVIIDDQRHLGGAGDGQNRFGGLADLRLGPVLGA